MGLYSNTSRRGVALVGYPNELLCKIHHAAFDKHILGVRPDYEIVVREDVLQEVDGPMLTYGLQKLHGSFIIIPKRRDHQLNQGLLEERFAAFRKAS